MLPWAGRCCLYYTGPGAYDGHTTELVRVLQCLLCVFALSLKTPPPPGLSGPHVPFENVVKINLDKLETKGNCSSFTLGNKRRLNH